jgi:hypothetical protein
MSEGRVRLWVTTYAAFERCAREINPTLASSAVRCKSCHGKEFERSIAFGLLVSGVSLQGFVRCKSASEVDLPTRSALDARRAGGERAAP